jgi:hypothetical protein
MTLEEKTVEIVAAQRERELKISSIKQALADNSEIGILRKRMLATDAVKTRLRTMLATQLR